MDEITLPNMGFNWEEVVAMIKTTGIDFAINLVTAIAIFYIGRIVVRLITRGLRKVMDAQDVDKTLVTFVSNLANMVLMLMVFIAAIDALGV